MLSCHLAIAGDGEHDELLRRAQSILHDDYEIEHSTIQVEHVDKGCPSPHDNCN